MSDNDNDVADALATIACIVQQRYGLGATNFVLGQIEVASDKGSSTWIGVLALLPAPAI